MPRRILDQHLEYKDKSMSELIKERADKLLLGQNTLRKRWLPEKYVPILEKNNPH